MPRFGIRNSYRRRPAGPWPLLGSLSVGMAFAILVIVLFGTL